MSIYRFHLILILMLEMNFVISNNSTKVLVLLPGRRGNFYFPFGMERAGAAGIMEPSEESIDVVTSSTFVSTTMCASGTTINSQGSLSPNNLTRAFCTSTDGSSFSLLAVSGHGVRDDPYHTLHNTLEDTSEMAPSVNDDMRRNIGNGSNEAEDILPLNSSSVSVTNSVPGNENTNPRSETQRRGDIIILHAFRGQFINPESTNPIRITETPTQQLRGEINVMDAIRGQFTNPELADPNRITAPLTQIRGDDDILDAVRGPFSNLESTYPNMITGPPTQQIRGDINVLDATRGQFANQETTYSNRITGPATSIVEDIPLVQGLTVPVTLTGSMEITN